MVCIQRFLRQLKVKIILSKFTPGQGQKSINIATDNCTFGRHRRHLDQAIKLLIQLRLHVLGQLQLGNLALVLSDFTLYILCLAQLLADGLNLLPQIVFLLVLLHLLMHLLGNTLGHARNLLLAGQELIQIA